MNQVHMQRNPRTLETPCSLSIRSGSQSFSQLDQSFGNLRPHELILLMLQLEQVGPRRAPASETLNAT